MTPEQFFEMRLKYFFLKLRDYNRKKENETRIELETVRLQTTALINVQLPKEERIKPPQLWKLPWDEETEAESNLKQLTTEELTTHYKNFIGKGFGNTNANSEQ